jgi:hypothetical protein
VVEYFFFAFRWKTSFWSFVFVLASPSFADQSFTYVGDVDKKKEKNKSVKHIFSPNFYSYQFYIYHYPIIFPLFLNQHFLINNNFFSF